MAVPLHVGGAGSLLQQQRGLEVGGLGAWLYHCMWWGWITASAAAWTGGGWVRGVAVPLHVGGAGSLLQQQSGLEVG